MWKSNLDRHSREEIASLYANTNTSIHEIAKMYGLPNHESVRAIARYLGKGTRPTRCAERQPFISAARLRGISVTVLKRRVLEKVAEDNLFDAVLDDA